MSEFTFQERLNHWYLVVVYGVFGFIGSGLSITVIGTLGYSTMRLVLNRRLVQASLLIKIFALAGIGYFLSGVLMFIANNQDPGIENVVFSRLPFLLLLPLFYQISISDRAVIKDSFGIGILISALAIGGWVIFGFVTDVHRLTGGAGNAGPFATTCAFIFAMSLLFFISMRDKYSMLYLAAALVAVLGLIMSGMRLFYPYLLVAPFILTIIYRRQATDFSTLRNVVILAILIGIIVLAAYPFVENRVDALLANYQAFGFEPSNSTSLGKRIALWQCAIADVPNAPFLGFGPHDALDYMSSCTLDLVGKPLKFTHFHNYVLTAFMFGGLFEFLSVSFLLFAVPVMLIWSSWHNKIDDCQRFALAASLLVLAIYLLQGSVNLMFGHDIHDFLFIHANVLFLVLFQKKAKRDLCGCK